MRQKRGSEEAHLGWGVVAPPQVVPGLFFDIEIFLELHFVAHLWWKDVQARQVKDGVQWQAWDKHRCLHWSLIFFKKENKSMLERDVAQKSANTIWCWRGQRLIHYPLPTVLGPPRVNIRTWAHIITWLVKIRLRRHSSRHLASAPLTSLSYMTCFGIVLPSLDWRWGNVAGGGLVHTIIWQSSHYRSISHILHSSTTCQLMLSASCWTLGPNTSLA